VLNLTAHHGHVAPFGICIFVDERGYSYARSESIHDVYPVKYLPRVVDIYSFRLVLAGSVDHCADRKSTDRSVCLGDRRVVRDTVESSMFRYVGSLKVKEFDLVPGHCVDHPAFVKG